MKKLGIILLICSLVNALSYIQHNYSILRCTVVKVTDKYTDIEDRNGHVWTVLDTDLQVGNKVKLKMHDNYTTNDMSDDIVKKVIKIK